MSGFAYETIGLGSPHLARVKEMGRASKATVGFLPDGAFDEYAARKLIVVAVEIATAKCVGYLLYRISQNRATVVHLCIDTFFRRRGIARGLFHHLRDITGHLTGILVKYRRDFPDDAMWPRLGFTAVHGAAGRSQEGHELTFWWYDHGHPTLFSSVATEDAVMVVIDMNVFIDLYGRRSSEGEESDCLRANWLPRIELCITDEVLNEIERNDDRDERRRLRQAASKLRHLPASPKRYDLSLSKVQALFPDPAKPSDEADVRHIARAVAADAEFFVTRDQSLLDKSDEVSQQFDVSILRPTDFILRLDEITAARRYHPRRLAGTLLALQRVRSGEESKLSDQFRSSERGERRADFLRALRACLADPQKNECRVIREQNNEPLGLVGLTLADRSSVDVPLFRVQRGSMLNTLARHLVFQLLTEVAKRKREFLFVSDPCVTADICQVLRQEPFVEGPNGWLKVVCRFVGGLEGFASRIRRSLAQLPADYKAQLPSDFSLLRTEHYQESVVELERLFWPAKITDSSMPCFIVPIRPIWAQHLFDEGLASQTLFGARLTPALLRECVYYRAKSAHGGLTAAPARILWYVSKDPRVQGSGEIRAYSNLERVTIGPAAELYRASRRYGIYEWPEILRLAGANPSAEIMTLHFRDTELLSAPVPWGPQLQEILGRSAPIQSPTRIDEHMFARIYGHGMEKYD